MAVVIPLPDTALREAMLKRIRFNIYLSHPVGRMAKEDKHSWNISVPLMMADEYCAKSKVLIDKTSYQK